MTWRMTYAGSYGMVGTSTKSDVTWGDYDDDAEICRNLPNGRRGRKEMSND